MDSRGRIVTHVFDGEEVVTDSDQQWVATFDKPEDARLFVEAEDLLAMVRKYASECAECGGSGEIITNKRGGDPAYDVDKPCSACAEIWGLIRRAEGA